ncbi:DNA-directed RNA polymerase II subunit RPB1-like [Raphanus sativus]|nr:DNA-directed RNA polymerase II subunit RPB1-like [Raphanus sativus]
MEQLIANNHHFTNYIWPGGDCSEPVFKVTPPQEAEKEPPHKKHTVPQKRKVSKLKPKKVLKKRAATTSQRRITRLFAASTSNTVPTNELVDDRVTLLEAKVTEVEEVTASLKASVSTLTASNERLKGRVNSLINRKRKRSTSGSLLSKLLVKHRRKSTPQSPQNNRHTTTHLSPDHHSPAHHSSIHSNHDTALSDHPTHNHKSPSPLTSPVHASPDHQTQNPQDSVPSTPTQITTNHNSHDHNYSETQEPHLTASDHNSPVHGSRSPNANDHVISAQPPTNEPGAPDHLPTDQQTVSPRSPNHVSTHTSPTHQPPSEAFNPTQGSPSQQYALIGTLPQFDSTPFEKPAPLELMFGPDNHLPIYDSSALLHSPPPPLSPSPVDTTTPICLPRLPSVTTTPTCSPNKPAVSPQGFSGHSSSPNAFAATALLKGSTSTFQSTPTEGPDKEGRKCEDGGKEVSKSSSPDTKARTSDQDVCELSDSSPAKKKAAHSPSEEEKDLHQALCRPDFPHYLLIADPPVDLWNQFSKTLSSRKKGFHVTPSKLDFDNQFLSS